MGFKSGEFLGPSNTGTWLSFSHFLTTLDLWTGSPSCMKWLHRRISQNGSSCQFGPRYEGQLTRMAEPILPSGQSSSYSLTTLSSSSSTDRRAETDRMVIATRIVVAHHFTCRLRRRESCILGATSSQPTLSLHELPPARLVIHRQTSNHERRKGTLSVQSRSGILVDCCPRQH